MLSLLRNLSQGTAPAVDNATHPDTSETVYISALALLKMLRHARSGVPMEVMGLMLGDFVDDYTINVLDVFAMPQSGTGVSVEAVDPVFQTKMMDLLKQTGRQEMVVGWYHSHPGFGCWLSSVDVNTQQSFEALSPRAVAVVIDPIQSVKGKVVIDVFRSIPNLGMSLGKSLAPTAEPRQLTSNLGHLVRSSYVAQMRGLGSRYYSLPISFKMNSQAQKMLQCVHKKDWSVPFVGKTFNKHKEQSLETAKEMLKMVKAFTKEIELNKDIKKDEAELKAMGKLNPKRRLGDLSRQLLEENIVGQTRDMINSSVFR
ncbi:unnamed protein product [Bursaphelenchus okinawaensis]|uniref:MPN domain-containing protein n=1 Tax=Bursaphelenchus okinawaensis TaxID=465554 RepID=A0A811K3P8_9BILA|nr:unnamed protein product [Bursaphelenchus okinawaensis]CAG9091597.1 unnamed protein product [Bursaphelenchus okinawaensis]